MKVIDLMAALSALSEHSDVVIATHHEGGTYDLDNVGGVTEDTAPDGSLYVTIWKEDDL